MKPVDQTIFTPQHGDCMRACVASILEWPIEKVPNFNEEGHDHYEEKLTDWAKEYGITILDVRIEDKNLLRKAFKGVYLIAFGQSPRFDCDHAVVYRGKFMAHDPHPSRDGLKGKPKGFSLFIVADYQKFFKRYIMTEEEQATCWLCNSVDPVPDTEIIVECETPGGEPCLPKKVMVHYGCYMDIES